MSSSVGTLESDDAYTVSSFGDNKATIIRAVVPTESRNDQLTPLMRAATQEDPSELLVLLRGEDAASMLFVKDEKGRTALDWARMCNNPLAIIALRKAMLANIEDARVEMIRAPEDLDEKTRYANSVAHIQLAEALKQRRADACIEIINGTKDHFERTDVEKIEGEVYFLDIGDHFGFTPLMLASTYNMPALVALLLEFDVELESKNKYGYTALSCACATGHADIVKSLLFAGANLHHKTNEGRTGLHLACMYLKARVISVLLDFLFERFSTYRLKHPKYGFDSTRWTRYATMMEGFMDIKDATGKTAWELLPLPQSLRKAQLGQRLAAGLGSPHLLLPDDSPIKRPKITPEKLDEELEAENDGEDRGSDADEDEYENENEDGDEGKEKRRRKEPYEVPMALPVIDPATVATLTTHKQQQQEHSERIKHLLDKDAGVGIVDQNEPGTASPTFAEQARRAASAGSMARPGGPLPYPELPKAMSAAEIVAQLSLKEDEAEDDLAKVRDSSSVASTMDSLLSGAPLQLQEEQQQQQLVLDTTLPVGQFQSPQNSFAPSMILQGRDEDDAASHMSLESTLSLSSMPQFSHDTDDFVRERTDLVDASSVLTANALEEEVKIILLLNQQARDRIEGWRVAAHAEDLLDKKVPCWLGCGFEEVVEGVAAHVRDLCPFRGKQCNRCRQIFKFIELEQHREHECPKRPVGCPNAWEGCLEMPAFEFVYQHTHLRCKFRKVPCRNSCGGMIPICKRDDHEETHCNKRGLTCDQCKGVVEAIRYGRHLKEECAERLVTCSVSCRGKFKFKDVAKHETEECVQPCKWNCGRRIGPAELRGMHEFIGCPRRPVTCKFGCGLGGLTAEFIREHEKYQCPEKMQRCPNGCGDRVKRRDLALHVDSWHGTCPERLTRCPSDFVGWKVYKVYSLSDQVTPSDCRPLHPSASAAALLALTDGPEEEHKASAVEASDAAGNSGAVGESKDSSASASSSSSSSLVKSRLTSFVAQSQQEQDQRQERSGPDFLNGSTEVGIILKYSRVSLPEGHAHARANMRHHEGLDQLHLKFPNRHEVIDYWSLGSTVRLIPLQKVQGDNVFKAHKATKFTCGWVACTALEHHLAYECAKRPVWLAGKHDATGVAGQAAEFRSSVKMAEIRDKFDEFIEAPPTTVTCEFCAFDFPPADLLNHQRTNCGGVAVRCKLGCGKRMIRSMLQDHAENHCPKRPLTCSQCGDRGMWVDEMDNHLNHECSMRPVPCSLGCGIEGLVASTEEAHRFNDCPWRIMTCTCGAKLRVCEHPDHMISDCPDKPTLCPQGCGVIVGRQFVPYHIEFDCTKKGIYFSRMEFCPIGCGTRMQKKDIIHHVTYTCQRRLSDCPLGCGQTIQFEKLRLHLYFCPRRPLCCEPGMKECNRLFFKWFYDDGGMGKNMSGLAKENDEASVETKVNPFDEVGVRGLLDDPEEDNDWDNNSVSTMANTLSPDGRSVTGGQQQLQLGWADGTVAKSGGGGALVPYSASGRARAKTPASRPQTSASRPTTAKLLGLNPDNLPMKSSITVVESRMFLKTKLRLKGCKRHGSTALMAALRLNEIELARFIVKSTEGMDLELENVAGETALTLACRLGKLDFVELLVQNGADVNYETSLGKTALIETVRAPFCSIPIVDFLVAAGALVAYKTIKHGRSAIEWSKLLMLPTVVRILELGEIVQKQTTLLFNAVSCGDNVRVRELIGDGDFFDPNNETILYDKMETEIEITRKAHVDAAELRKNMKDLTGDVEAARVTVQQTAAEYEGAKKIMDGQFLAQDNLTMMLSKLFTTYERIADTLLRSDLEELGRLRKPDLAVRGAVFCYGILLGLLKVEDYPENDFSFEHAKKWWPVCAASLQDSVEAIKRIRAFSLDRLRSTTAKPLLDRARSMYRDLSLAISQSRREATAEAVAASVRSLSSRGSPGGTPAKPSSRSGRRSPKGAERGGAGAEEEMGDHPVVIRTWGKRSSHKAARSKEEEEAAAADAAGGKNRFAKNPHLEDFADPQRLAFFLADTDDLKGIRPRTQGRSPSRVEVEASPKEKAPKLSKEERKTLRLAKKQLAEELKARDSGSESSGSEGIPDVDWDSEADEAGGGEFVKGQWVPMVKKKEKWWLREPKKGSKEEAALQAMRAEEARIAAEKEAKRAEIVKKYGQAPKKQWGKPKEPPPQEPENPFDTHRGKSLSRGTARAVIVNLAAASEAAAAERDANNARLYGTGKGKSSKARDASSSSAASPPRLLQDGQGEGAELAPGSPSAEVGLGSRPTTSEKKESIVERAYNAAMSDTTSVHFVRCILVLLKAANQLAEDQVAILRMKEEVVAVGQQFEEARVKAQAAHVAFLGAQSKRLMTEKNLIDMIRYARFTLKRAKRYREKLRVARLLNKVTAGGHTVISYAASLGNTEAVDMLLTHGASVGYNAQLLHLTASYLQLSYRLYRFVTEAKREGLESAKDKFKKIREESKKNLADAKRTDRPGGADNDEEEEAESQQSSIEAKPVGSVKTDVNVTGEFQAATSAQLIEKMFAMKEHRNYILNKIRFFRSKMRFPVPEAAYRGQWEVIRRIEERRLFHRNFSSTWIFPCPGPPFIKHFYRHQVKPEKLGMLTVLAHGMNNISAGTYVELQGWVGANDPRDHYGLAHEYLEGLTEKLDRNRASWAQERYRIRCLALERRKSGKCIPQFCQAVRDQDWRVCIFLASKMGVSIDHEADFGVTCLVAAAEEDTGRLNYAPMLNDDGRGCLGVEYLLDRTEYRPQVNLELNDPCAHTALIRAASLGRSACVQALIDRGADVNRKNRLGKVALHYAAESGSYDSVRILLERGADLSILNPDGRSAYDIAEEYGFQSVVKQISRYGNGFLGPVRAFRGRVDELERCPLGCGKDMVEWDVPAHLKVCPLRIVVCPVDCGERLIMAKELDDHIVNSCARRKVPCDWCFDAVEFRDVESHKETSCVHRLTECALGCGQVKKVYEMKKHLKFCTFRVVPCQLSCGLELCVYEMSHHVKQECKYRKMVCPYECSAIVSQALLHNHMSNVCPLRPANCRFCSLKLVYKELEQHERSCHVREEPCPAGCGEAVCITETKVHMATTCTHRFVPCPLKCNQKIRLCDTKSHCEHICDMRLLPCPNKCVEDENLPLLEQRVCQITAKMMELHTSLQCPERMVQCINCRQDVKAKVSRTHKETSCTMRPVACRNPGCSKELALGDREEHERKTCKFKLVVCPQGCGELVAAIYAGRHMMLACSWRHCKCPLGCGEAMRHHQLREHMDTDCVRRHNIASAEYGGGGRKTGRSSPAPGRPAGSVSPPRGRTSSAGSAPPSSPIAARPTKP